MSRAMTVREAAEVLGVCEGTVMALIHGGRLPALRLRRSYRVRPDDLAALLHNPPMPAPTRRAVTAAHDPGAAAGR